MTLEELAERLARLEARVEREAQLRAAVDRDVADQGAEISATHHLVQALAITQSQHTGRLEALAAKVDAHSLALARVEAGVGRIIDMLGRLG